MLKFVITFAPLILLLSICYDTGVDSPNFEASLLDVTCLSAYQALHNVPLRAILRLMTNPVTLEAQLSVTCKRIVRVLAT